MSRSPTSPLPLGAGLSPELLARLSPEQRQLLERRLAALPRREDLPARVGIERVDRSSPRFRASFAQQRLGFVYELDSSNPNNVAAGLELRGSLRPARLWHAITGLLGRHETLRTRLVRLEGELEQEIVAAEELAEHGARIVVDLSALPVPVTVEVAAALVAARVGQRFELEHLPQLSVSLLRLSAQHHQLLFVAPHLAVDGWSVGLLLEELARGYAGETLAPPAVQYLDYAVWQRRELSEERCAELLALGRDALAGAPRPLELPIDRQRPPVQDVTGSTVPLTVPGQLAAACRRLAQQQGATLYTVLLAAFATTLARWSGAEDLLIGSASANRTRPELSRVVGPLVNALVVRADLRAAASFAALVERLHGAVLAAHARQDLPFERLVEALEPERDPARPPLFETAFLLQNFPATLPALPGLELALLDPPRRQSRFELALLLTEGADGLLGEVQYASALFERTTIEAFAASFGQVLAAAVAEPERRLAELPLTATLLAQASRRRPRPVVIAATFTAEPVAESIEFWSQLLDLPLALRFAPYGQVFQELLDPTSQFARNHGGLNVVLLRFEDWLGQAPGAAASERLGRSVDELRQALEGFVARRSTPILVVVLPPSRAALDEPDLALALARAEARLATELAGLAPLRFVPWKEWLELYPVDVVEDREADALGHIPYSAELFAGLGTLVVRNLYARLWPPAKVVAVDCDNTLWSGVVAEDGVEGVGLGPARLALQERLVALEQAGVLLALVSKNERADVEDVFRQRPEMVLSLDRVVACKIGWQAKSDSLLELARDLSLGLSSFVLLDDSPLECAEVGSRLPEVLALELPADEAALPRFLDHVWAFDRRRTTDEDRERTELYRRELERERARRGSYDYGAFLASLELVVEVAPLAAGDVGRAVQLAQRTNQFNTTTVRYTEAELARFGDDGGTLWTVRVSDRFGSYGLVGLVLWRPAAAGLRVESFLLSCRVLGRGVEHRVLAALGEAAEALGVTTLELPLRQTRRNQPALDFLLGLPGVERQTQGAEDVFILPVALARSVRLDPQRGEGAAAVTEAASPIGPEVPVSGGLSPALARRIATELASPAGVLAALRSRRRRARGKGPYEAPAGPLEARLSELFAEVLRVERVGRHDSFFALGGHSLTGTLLLARIERELEVALPLLTLFERASPAQLAEIVEERLVATLDAAELAASMRDLEGCSEDEIRRLLEAEQAAWRLAEEGP